MPDSSANDDAEFRPPVTPPGSDAAAEPEPTIVRPRSPYDAPAAPAPSPGQPGQPADAAGTPGFAPPGFGYGASAPAEGPATGAPAPGRRDPGPNPYAENDASAAPTSGGSGAGAAAGSPYVPGYGGGATAPGGYGGPPYLGGASGASPYAAAPGQPAPYGSPYGSAAGNPYGAPGGPAPYGARGAYGSPYGGVAPTAYPMPAYAVASRGSGESSWLGLTALICGIIAIVTGVIPFVHFVAGLPALLAIVFGVIGIIRLRFRRSLAIVGTVLGVLGMTASILWTVGFSSWIGSLPDQDPGYTSSSSPYTGSTPGQGPDFNGGSLADTFGDFTPITQTGIGDATIDIPDEAHSGLVTIDYDGDRLLQAATYDDAGNYVDEVMSSQGEYHGTSVYGTRSYGSQSDTLEISGTTGTWTVTISPISTAKPAALPASGRGDIVFAYDGAGEDWALEYTGDSNFIVEQVTTAGDHELLLNEIDSVSKTVTLVAGPSIIHIAAYNGDWTASAA
ncbi:DUF4190 domain-containing protein [Schumannella sp. 10F1B-5-1]|uniref:DUF4190 domain-containing protein n=1 Tax=Schumannella sp. 10F1B-5-1 TaxID=2590780 RepID=UPI0011310645|nr:DUF4190 domain-containing protein [Schumannella sp. 10F1B-5-1]TPW76924.1 hypothetical protein FJ658_03085 [Schumannella sp. 10F1B-5-1]